VNRRHLAYLVSVALFALLLFGKAQFSTLQAQSILPALRAIAVPPVAARQDFLEVLQQGNNLAPNPSFEVPDPNNPDIPAGWPPTCGALSGWMGRDASEAHSGTYSLRTLYVFDCEAKWSATVTLPNSPPDYNFLVWYKNHGPCSSVYVQFQGFDEDGNSTLNTQVPFNCSITWTQATTTIPTAQARSGTGKLTRTLKINIQYAPPGIITWWDDVELVSQPPPTVQFTAASYTVNENAGTATATVTLNAALTSQVTVNYAATNGTASAGSDYTAASGTLTYNPGETSKTFTVQVTNDTLDESDETINLTLSNPSNGTLGIPAGATLTIIDDDVQQSPCYTLNTSIIPSGVGTITKIPLPNCAGNKYTPGTVVSLSATANASYVFSQWSGAASGNANPLSVTMDRDKNLIANFNQATSSISGRVTDGQFSQSQVGVASHIEWQDTGITVQTGDQVQVTYLSGAWTIWTGLDPYTDANGQTGRTDACTLLPSVNTGSLIGRITTGTAQFIGNTGSFSAQSSGTLQLSMNDCTGQFQNNDGTLTIRVTVTPAANNPIPGVTIADGAGHGATTDASGNYILPGLATGTYTLTPSKSGYTFSPPWLSVAVPPNVIDRSFTGTLPPVNSPPVANNQTVTTAQNTPRTITLTASDANNDPLTYILISSPANGALTGTAPNLTYTPRTGFTGADSFTFKVNDGKADSNLATISITVTQLATNQAPSVNAGVNQTIILPSNATLDAAVTDDGLPNPPNAVTVTWSKITGSGTVTFASPNAVDTTVTFSSPGTYILRLTASDGQLTNNDDITVTVQSQATCFTLTTTISPSRGGTVVSAPLPNCQGTKYTFGTSILLTATVSSGYVFSQWSGSASSNTNPLRVTMDGDKNIIANFNQLPTADFSIDIVPVQVVEGADLVVNKPLAVKVIVIGRTYEEVNDVQLTLRYRNDKNIQQELPTFFLNSPEYWNDSFQLETVATSLSFPANASTQRQVYFIAEDLRPTVSGQYPVDVILTWPGGQKIEERAFNVVSGWTNGQRILFFPVEKYTLNEADITEALELVRAVYPISPTLIQRSPHRPEPYIYCELGPLNPCLIGLLGLNGIIKELFLVGHSVDPSAHRLIAVTPANFVETLQCGVLGCTGDDPVGWAPASASYVVLVEGHGLPAFAQEVAHELGHSWGYPDHDGTGTRDNPSYVSDGFWPSRRQRMNTGDKRHDGSEHHVVNLMGALFYDPSLNTHTPSWLTEFSYQKFIEVGTPKDPLASAAVVQSNMDNGHSILVSGFIYADGRVELNPWYRMPVPPPDPPPGNGNYSIEIFDTSGNVLYKSFFYVDFAISTLPITSEVTFFGFSVPDFDTAAFAFVRSAEVTVAQRFFSSHAPSVMITRPQSNQTITFGDTIKWNATDADGDTLTYIVLISGDGGVTWNPLIVDTSATEFVLNRTLSPGDQYYLKVIATDNINTGTAIFGPFKVSAKLFLPLVTKDPK